MKKRDYTKLMSELKAEYVKRFPRSAELHETAKKYMVDGGSHTLRLMDPFPQRIAKATGGRVLDEDGHEILDFWQGHIGNVLGYNPEIITQALADCFSSGSGLQVGKPDLLQIETAEVFCGCTGNDQVRFTTSGTLATMYSMMLARVFTGRNLILKVGGGWHGGHAWALKGVSFSADHGFQHLDSEGLTKAATEEVLVTVFNDTERLKDHFDKYGDKIACFIVEPYIGVGGFIPAHKEYLETARQLTEKHGALLIFDEVIDGFRFRAGSIAPLYGVKPDLNIFGKAIGGGMPVAAVGGRADIMALAGIESGLKVGFSGGTYSAHTSSLLAAKLNMEYLVANEAEVYPLLGKIGAKFRDTMENAFRDEGIFARCTGHTNDAVPESSFGFIHFPYSEDKRLEGPEDIYDPAFCDTVLNSSVLQLALSLEDVHLPHGFGSVATTHTLSDMEFLSSACRNVARRIKPYM